MQRPGDRQAPDEFRYQPELDQVFRLDLRQRVAESLFADAGDIGVKAQRLAANALFDDLFKPDKSAAADEKNIGGINGEEFLMRMLASALRRHVGDGAFQNLQQGLLYAFAADVAGDRRVFVFAANLIDFIDVDDAGLGAFDVAVGCLQQFQYDVLDVFADVTGLCQRRRIDDAEGHVEHARQRLCQQRLAGASRANQQDVGFLNLNIRRAPLEHVNAFVMLINRDGEFFLSLFLADDVIIE